MKTPAPILKSCPAALFLVLAILGLLLLPSSPARAQMVPPPVQAAPPPYDFPIGISDLVDITVLGVPEFTKELRVSAAGTIRLPFLGEIKVDGLMPAQAETKLAELLNPNYVKDPQVSVTVKEPRSRMFSILGAVIKPGQYQMLEPVTLVTAIAGDKATIQRTSNANSNAVQPVTARVPMGDEKPGSLYQIEVDLRKLLQGDMSRDIPIMPGDIISISERQAIAFYVIGEVNRPGPFDFHPERGIKLSRALAMAGGPTKMSKMKDTALIRQHPDGTMDRMALNLDKVLRGKAPDIELQPNDMIYIPGSLTKNIGWGMLGIIPQVATRMVIPY